MERVARQPKKAWMAGCIFEKLGVFLQKELREDVGLRVDFVRSRGFSGKILGERRLYCGLIFVKSEDFFVKWLGNRRSPGRWDGRKKRETWPHSQAGELARICR